MQHLEWSRGFPMNPHFPSSSFGIEDILGTSIHKQHPFCPPPPIYSTPIPKPDFLPPYLCLNSSRTCNLPNPLNTPAFPSFSFNYSLQAPSIPSIFEAYNDPTGAWSPFLSKLPQKKKGGQVRFSNEQTVELEKMFESQKYLSPAERKQLSKVLQLSERQIKTWFQNRRAKWRRLRQEETRKKDDDEDSSSEIKVVDLKDSWKTSQQEEEIDKSESRDARREERSINASELDSPEKDHSWKRARLS